MNQYSVTEKENINSRSLDATLDRMCQPIKIDISTDDVITPKAIEYDYKYELIKSPVIAEFLGFAQNTDFPESKFVLR